MLCGPVMGEIRKLESWTPGLSHERLGEPKTQNGRQNLIFKISHLLKKNKIKKLRPNRLLSLAILGHFPPSPTSPEAPWRVLGLAHSFQPASPQLQPGWEAAEAATRPGFGGQGSPGAKDSFIPPPTSQHWPLGGPWADQSSLAPGAETFLLPAGLVPRHHPAPEAEKPSLRGGKRAPNASSPTQRAARTHPAAEQPQLPPVLPIPARQGGKKRCPSASPHWLQPLLLWAVG